MHHRLSLKDILVGVLLCAASTGTAFAARQDRTILTTTPAGVSDDQALSTAKGLIMLDYEVIPVPGNPSIDLLGFHYLHQLNPWLYLGLGLHAPLVYGDYGGFMVVDATIHAQHRLFGHTFVDGGLSFGGGGGGSSIQQSKALSGNGGFIKGYAGLGYDFRGFTVGVNYSRLRFSHALIDHSQFDVFVQRPINYTIGRYADAGEPIAYQDGLSESGEDIISLELNNMFRLKPKGSNRKTIHLLALQFSHFVTRHGYLFFEAEAGYKGLPLYNQALGGIGYRLALSPRINLYGQVGAGSGGYAPTVIDTGPGLLVYPKLSLEYLWNNKVGLSVSGGYLFAPKGSSRNYTLGAAVNYHLAGIGDDLQGSNSATDLVLRGFRVDIFHQTEFGVRAKGKKLADINMLSAQFDYLMDAHWYVPLQASVSYRSVLGYPGYGEMYTGLGVQTGFSATSRFQNYFQILVGAGPLGIALKPSLGFTYGLSDHYALYGQLSEAFSEKRFRAYGVGLGLSYRFSLPDSLAE